MFKAFSDLIFCWLFAVILTAANLLFESLLPGGGGLKQLREGWVFIIVFRQVAGIFLFYVNFSRIGNSGIVSFQKFKLLDADQKLLR